MWEKRQKRNKNYRILATVPYFKCIVFLSFANSFIKRPCLWAWTCLLLYKRIITIIALHSNYTGTIHYVLN